MISIVADEERVLAEASAWLVRLQADDVSEADGIAFDAWLDAAPEHRAAYGRALALWQTFEAAGPDVAAVLDAAARKDRLRPPGATRRWWIGAGGAALAAGLGVAVIPGLLAAPATIETFATGKGERKRVILADGSTIDLNAETRLSVTLDRGSRRVQMADGEAIFDVAHDAARPFTVAAAGREVRVLGTQFDVRSRQGELTVTVARGRVQVSPEAAGRAFVLTRGQRLKVASSGHAELNAVDPAEVFSWRSGRLIYRGEPLKSVVADLNRQYVPQIEVTDPQLAQMPITGVIVLDEHPKVVERLSLMLPVRSVPSERGLLLLRK